MQDGRVEIGGSLSAGRMHGLWHIMEAALHASGRADAHQAPSAKIAFAGASGANINATFVFSDEPYERPPRGAAGT